MADNSDFTHLHAHGEYSMLDGVGTIEHVCEVAKNKGFRALAQTDHGNVSGSMKFARECKKSGIKPIIGCEIYVVDDPSWRKPEGIKETEQRYHTIVLAKNWNGFVSLQKLLTKGHSELGFYYKPRVGWNDVFQLKDCVVTSACVGGPLKHTQWKEKIKGYREAFGDDFYLEIQPHNFDMQFQNNAKALEMSLYTGSKILASNDFHYAQNEDCHAQKALLAIRDKKTQSSDDQWDFTPGLYMRTYTEMFEAFGILKNSVITPELASFALMNSVEIVEKCEFKVPKLEVDLPNVDTSELGTADPDEALRKLCVVGWNKRFKFKFYDAEGTKYWDRLQHELELITRLTFSKYFLLVWDLYRFCNKEGIAYGPGRGSGAGSLVCYLLGITNADPLHYGLIFERFINPERIDLPDLDLDFEHERRDEVYRYLQRTYTHVAHIPVFSGMNAKQVLKDVCRFKEVSLEEIDPVCKEMERNTAKQDKAGLNIKKVEAQPDKYPLFTKFKQRNFAVVDIAKVLEGQVRQTGIHAGGVIVSAHDLTDRCALEWRKGDVSINFDMYDINDLALLKVDVLGSKTVSVLDRTVKLINKKLERKGIEKRLVLDRIPLDDEDSLKQFDRGQTTGIFQFESDGIRQLLRDMAPHDINTVITANAMYRPGPLQFKDIYIRQKKNPNLIKSTGNEALDKITSETFGVFIYQEQVMKIAVEVAGYTYPEADTLRKKISKSKGKEEVEKDRPKFVEGCVAFGKLQREVAERIFNEIVDFGRYAFNKSHSTTYSLISYYAMWLRSKYPHEFLCSSIAYSVDKMNAKEERLFLKKEAERLGINYLQPDINFSEPMCSIQEIDGKEVLRGGFNEIDGIGNAATEQILKTRHGVPFKSFYDFLERLDNKRIVNIGVQTTLLNANTFASIHNFKEAKQISETLRTKVSKKARSAKDPGQGDLPWLQTV